MRYVCKWALLLALCLGLYGCQANKAGPAKNDGESNTLQVAVVNYPLAYFAQRIGGEEVSVRFPAPADLDPAFWVPKAEEISLYQTADLILLNGASYASWVQGASLPESKVVQTSAAFDERLIPTISEIHSHGPEGEHSHQGTASTTWLDTELALLQARAVREAFVKARPSSKDLFEANYLSLEKDLQELDERLKQALLPLQDEPLLYSHPVYQYFDRAYQLNGESMHWEPGEMPTEESWQELDQILGHNPAKLMIWEAQPLEEIATRLRDKGVESVVFEPMGNKPAQGDYLSVRKASVERLEKALAD